MIHKWALEGSPVPKCEDLGAPPAHGLIHKFIVRRGAVIICNEDWCGINGVEFRLLDMLRSEEGLETVGFAGDRYSLTRKRMFS